MAREIEAKIKVESLEKAAATLARLGAEDKGKRFERNWVLDDKAESLRLSGTLLRVRTHGGEEAVLTVKSPVGEGEFKVREEIETRVDSASLLLKQLETLGFAVVWIYEKFRHTWIWHNCGVMLDQCPEIGSFIEVEGGPDDIRAVLADLALRPEQHIDDNYLGLWTKYLEERGEAKRDMVFPPESK